MQTPWRCKVGIVIAVLCGFALAFPALGLDLATKKNDELQKKALAVENGAMNNQKLEGILKAFTSIEEGTAGFWSVIFEGRPLVVVTDEAHNRMRIMTPIIEIAKLSKDDLMAVMKANFESALDARYAIFNNLLWSVYIHPLAELSGGQVLDAIRQVRQLGETYGASYSSTDVILNTK